MSSLSSCPHSRQLVGLVVLKSHCLSTKPQSFLLKLQDDSGKHHICLIDREEHLQWNKHILFGNKYLFTGLKRVIINLEDEQFHCWKTTEWTKWKQEQWKNRSAITGTCSPSRSPLRTISGSVTYVDPSVGLLTIDDKYDIIIAYQQPCSMVPDLYKGLKLTLHNIHIRNLTPEKSLGVLCTRGFIEILSHSKIPSDVEDILRPNLQSSLIMYALDLKIGVDGLLWIHEEARRQHSTFPYSFFSEHGFSSEEALSFREKMLKETIYYVMKNSFNVHPTRKMLGEFIKSDHSCLPMSEFSPVSHSVSPSSYQKVLFDLVEDSDMGEDAVLNTKVRCVKEEAQHYDLGLMIGFLKPTRTQSVLKEVSFYLVDGCSSFPCMITKGKKIVDPSECDNLCYAMLMSKNCWLVQQKLELESIEEPLHVQFFKIDVNDVVVIDRSD